MLRIIVQSIGWEKEGQLWQDPDIAMLAFPSLLMRQGGFVLLPLSSLFFLLSLLYRF